MAINFVSSTTNTAQQQQQQQQVAANQAQFRMTEGPRAGDEANRPPAAQSPTKQAEPAQRAAQPERVEPPEQPESPKPVVNAQGQKTGTIINTSA
ncbi:MAG: hypothetical protein Q8L93_09180 [Rhodocyclaceae bacterium]|nr:hypothetical protein [Rhodocyclaceae bacterium]MDP1956857.1 hypothetical protein [Rhodocyclaceae bacterium]